MSLAVAGSQIRSPESDRGKGSLHAARSGESSRKVLRLSSKNPTRTEAPSRPSPNSEGVSICAWVDWTSRQDPRHSFSTHLPRGASYSDSASGLPSAPTT